MKNFLEKLGLKSPHALKLVVVGIVSAVLVLGILYAFVLRDVRTPINIAAQNEDINDYTFSHYVVHTYICELCSQEEAQPNRIMIHISGHVANPYVYEFYEGARVIDAVNAAGGLTDYADENTINLADFLYDTQRIIVFGIYDNAPLATSGSGAPANTPSSGIVGGLVNINTATVEQLMTLNQIGESRARNIIAHRDARGGFRNIEELMNVTGIGESIFNGLRDSVTVGN